MDYRGLHLEFTLICSIIGRHSPNGTRMKCESPGLEGYILIIQLDHITQ
jgi:hypothetical protein